jgi:DNA-binding transcriptional MerR regulator
MQKLYYSISELGKLVDEEQHILRYWEKEFEQLKPRKNRAGNRVYSERDLIIIKIIKKLLRDDKLSIKGAKEQLEKFLLNNHASESLFMENLHLMSINDDYSGNFGKNGNNSINESKINEIKALLSDLLFFLKRI